MSGIQHFDIVVVGGGPAGTSAALRLLQLGYRVALIEQQAFPRDQIGESVSPGIWNILNYLNAGHLLQNKQYLLNLGALLIWETKDINSISSKERGPGIMIDRGRFDYDLLKLAVSKGLYLYQPAKFESCRKNPEHWEIEIRQAEGKMRVWATIILDARGRQGTSLKERALTGHPLVAIWTHIPASRMPGETIIEATKEGWLWGSPTIHGQFRVIIFIDPAQLKQISCGLLLSQRLRETRLFRAVAADLKTDKMNSCSVLPYAHINPWQDNYIRLGEAAFTLDPLSSTGVEKAMRFSLQAVIAVNTMLKTDRLQIAQSFYEDHLIESVATHTNWTREYYSKAWPGNNISFWKRRSTFYTASVEKPSTFYKKLVQRLKEPRTINESHSWEPVNVKDFLGNVWHKKVSLSSHISYLLKPCVVGDVLETRPAVQHPNLKRAVTYIEEIEIASMFNAVDSLKTVGELIAIWSRGISAEKVVKITTYLLHKRILATQE